jgi:hypothetical protein
MIRYKWHRNAENCLAQITLFWMFAIALHWYVHKGDHMEISLSLGPIDIRFGTSMWWNKLLA